ncbi:hypothetical protein CXF85_13260 [Colwellia sp. 75C3]|uniref:hypothetical protein n=1 Tax=Colwellia sp. 75C3 TaxID=888425 RepID=UPI000C31BE07|nr:hypothetical protein [Colwellia sp. 75C3]PKG82452.1 hypothetical protein CXF85_13260 [Colwellia sp. 75C3]
MNNIVKFIAVSILLFVHHQSVAASDVELEAEILKQKDQLQLIEKQLAELKTTLITAEEQRQDDKLTSHAKAKNWQINSYGSVLYKNEEVYRNIQDTNPERKATTDLERVVLEFVYDFDAKWQVEVELEYEHGGVGSTLEYDGFEEAGEFEAEIEAGGEVIVEKLQAKYKANDYFTVKMGHIFVPVGLGTDLHKPGQYFSTERYWSEATLIPQVWHETGINLISAWQGFTAQTLITTGLNSEYFRTYQWVATGHQKRFEQVNADDLALTLRLDYGNIKTGKGFGVSYYTGDTTGNRHHNTQIGGNGNLTIIGFHGAYSYDNWQVRGQYLLGTLDDSEAITNANKTTPGLKPGNFAQLGSEAESSFVELAYNSQALLNLKNPLYLYTTYEYANPIKKVEQGNATDRFNKASVAFGINYFPIKNIVLKAQVAQQMYAQSNLDDSSSFSLSMGYFFSI